jgi:hypothetical protein
MQLLSFETQDQNEGIPINSTDNYLYHGFIYYSIRFRIKKKRPKINIKKTVGCVGFSQLKRTTGLGGTSLSFIQGGISFNHRWSKEALHPYQ